MHEYIGVTYALRSNYKGCDPLDTTNASKHLTNQKIEFYKLTNQKNASKHL